MVVPTPNLSANDARILNALFDPETLPSSVARSKDASSIDASLPDHPSMSSSQLSALEAQQNDLVREISSSSDFSIIDSAIERLSEVIEKWPEYPSAYVNRAMLRRMKLEALVKESNGSIFDADNNDVEVLFGDLSKAIKVAVASSSPTAPVSPYQARIMRTAFSHRAYLYLKAAEKDISWKGSGKSELEEMASADFAAAAKYGDEVAREMSVRTNPYAKMCGAIVRNALAEERKETQSLA
ncbi:hypothetical protein BS50DRAFT_572860 [Corynespora cassiicola Philippines]|uniref:Tetratricopeptide repeat domain-containing protein n=1 Tax=Corynespora cassiicola Philippines TaxID=1448308 RepID=A0A2T2NR28_CORCC|nr:hypothetical protein BS50DRAFT_572860 [Corynespora cassiicola Philippines]